MYTKKTPSFRDGFSLIELLAVITIIVIMASLSAPVLSSLSNQAGRKGAVNILLNTFEQARVVALSTGVNSYVGFANEQVFTDAKSPYPYRAFIVFRDRTDDDPGTNLYVPLTKWTFLPDNISFWREQLSVVGAGASGVPNAMIIADSSLPEVSANQSLPVIAFSSSGSVLKPINSNQLRLFIYEGFFSNNQNNHRSQNRNYLERISFRRFTGRAELDISSPN